MVYDKQNMDFLYELASAKMALDFVDRLSQSACECYELDEHDFSEEMNNMSIKMAFIKICKAALENHLKFKPEAIFNVKNAYFSLVESEDNVIEFNVNTNHKMVGDDSDEAA